MEGKVKWFSEDKGFGFIVGNDGEERFFGVRDIKGADLPGNGDLVVFHPAQGKKGPKAANVKIMNKAEGKAGERVVCSNCGKKMIPRIITGPPLIHGMGGWTPVPKKSLCPFCGGTHQTFKASLGEKIGLAAFIVFFVLFVSLLRGIGSR